MLGSLTNYWSSLWENSVQHVTEARGKILEVGRHVRQSGAKIRTQRAGELGYRRDTLVDQWLNGIHNIGHATGHILGDLIQGLGRTLHNRKGSIKRTTDERCHVVKDVTSSLTDSTHGLAKVGEVRSYLVHTVTDAGDHVLEVLDRLIISQSVEEGGDGSTSRISSIGQGLLEEIGNAIEGLREGGTDLAVEVLSGLGSGSEDTDQLLLDTRAVDLGGETGHALGKSVKAEASSLSCLGDAGEHPDGAHGNNTEKLELMNGFAHPLESLTGRHGLAQPVGELGRYIGKTLPHRGDVSGGNLHERSGDTPHGSGEATSVHCCLREAVEERRNLWSNEELQ